MMPMEANEPVESMGVYSPIENEEAFLKAENSHELLTEVFPGMVALYNTVAINLERGEDYPSFLSKLHEANMLILMQDGPIVLARMFSTLELMVSALVRDHRIVDWDYDARTDPSEDCGDPECLVHGPDHPKPEDDS